MNPRNNKNLELLVVWIIPGIRTFLFPEVLRACTPHHQSIHRKTGHAIKYQVLRLSIHHVFGHNNPLRSATLLHTSILLRIECVFLHTLHVLCQCGCVQSTYYVQSSVTPPYYVSSLTKSNREFQPQLDLCRFLVASVVYNSYVPFLRMLCFLC